MSKAKAQRGAWYRARNGGWLVRVVKLTAHGVSVEKHPSGKTHLISDQVFARWYEPATGPRGREAVVREH